jgi:hypothetical protein
VGVEDSCEAAASELLAAALAYAARGWAVFPAKRDKTPWTPNGFTDATTDPDRIRFYWRQHPTADVAIATGAISGIVVLDDDTGKGGARGRIELERRIGKLPPTFEVLTGGGGRHLYFAHPGVEVRCSAGKFATAIDVRGDGGYVIAPPSTHKSGRVYKLLHERELARWPAPLLNGDNGQQAAEPLAAVTPIGRIDTDLTSLAGSMRRRGASEEAIYAALVQTLAQCEPGHTHTENDCRRIARSVARYAPAADGAVKLERAPVETTADVGCTPALTEVLEAVRGYPDVTPAEADYIIVALAVAVARALPDEEPLWLILTGPSGGGKTEAIRLPALVADCRVDELTRAGLLSYSALGKKVRRAGLLNRVPPVSFVTISDFSTVVTMGDREARARMFGMLRVVYDGRVYRSIGGQPASEGESLEWEGHLTLLAGATNAIDTHLSFEATLGERWLLFRLDESDADRARARTIFATHREQVPQLRKEAQELAAALVVAARERVPRALTDAHRDLIVDAAVFCAHARTGVQFEGTGKYRVPIGLPMPEEPMRLAGQLNRLARCLVALGLDERRATGLAIRAACDSVPLARFRALREVAETEMATVASVHRALGRGNRWAAKWELMALEAIGLVDVEGVSEDDDPAATRVYMLKDVYRGVYESVGSLFNCLSFKGERE